MKTIFTIGTKVSHTYGMGDYCEEIHICTEECYGLGPYPPCFTTQEAAEAYLATTSLNYNKCIVELKLIEP